MERKTIKAIDEYSKLLLIGQGNTADVYLYDDSKILKLFRDGVSLEAIKGEYETVQAVCSKLKNVPRAFEIVLYKARYGIVYERVIGVDMIKAMTTKTYKIKAYLKSLALVHSEIHKVTVDIPCDVKMKLSANIDVVKELTKIEKNRIKSYLNALPSGNSLCHFDFHPGNVMIQNNTLYVIDWMMTCIGNPNADVARTFLLLRFGELQYASPIMKAITRIFERHIWNIYYREYTKITGISNRDMEQWILPVAAARLTEGITDSEKRKLLKLVRKKLQCFLAIA